MKKTVFFCVLAALSQMVFAGAKKEDKRELVIYGLKGPSGVGMIQMFDSVPEIEGFTVKMEALASADLMVGRLVSGDAKMGILPTNTAAKLAASGTPVQAAAVTGCGMLSLLSANPEVTGIASLAGRTVIAAGKSAVPEYVFRKILASHGLDAEKDLTLDFSPLSYPEITAAVASGRAETALLPEPFATMACLQNPALHAVCDVQEEWKAASGTDENYPISLFVVNSGFASENPEAVRAVLAAYRASIEWVTANPAEAGALVEKHDLGLKAPVVAASVPKSAYLFIPAIEARPALETLFEAFLEFDPSSIGGALPADTFYYQQP